jgi:hypothetical protein
MEGLLDATQELLGEEVTFSPAAGGGPFTLNAIFDTDTEVVGGDAGVVSYVPTLALKLSDCPVEPDEGDEFTIGGVDYKVGYFLEKDAEGGAVLVLNKDA